MEDNHRLYQVIETDGMNVKELQCILNKATDDFPEKKIDHVIGTKIILGFESSLNAKGRAQVRMAESLRFRPSMAENMMSGSE